MGSLPKWITPTVKQTWVVMPVLLIKIGTGMMFGFSSALISALEAPDSDIKMDMDTTSWYVSSMSLSLIIGLFTGSAMVPRYGRRIAFLFNMIPSIVGLLVTYYAPNVTALMIGTSITIGSNIMIGIVNVGEYTSPRNRGMFLYMVTAALSIGSLIVHAVGYYTTWRTLTLVVSIPFILCFLIAYTWPESPSWLAERKEYEKSRQAFYWLRGRTEESTREIEELIRAQNYKKIDKTVSENIVDFFRKFKKKNFLKPLLVIFVSNILEECGGRHVFPSYAAQLIKEVTSSDVNKFYYNIVIDILIVFSGITSSYLIRVMRVRTLLFTSGAAASVTLCLASLSLYLVNCGVISGDYSVVTMVLFVMFFVLSNLACTSVPLTIRGEIFPLEHRVVASVMALSIASINLTVFLKIVPILLSVFYIYGTFAILGVSMTACLFILYFILPETTQKTLQDIENYFDHKSLRESNVGPTDEEGDEPHDKLNKC